MPTTSKIPVFEVQVGDRGRLVLPAQARKQLGIAQGSRLILTLDEPGVMKLTSAKAAADRCLGILRESAGNRLISEELISERRESADRE